MPNLKQKPLFSCLPDQYPSSASNDGELIAKGLILNHGYSTNRFLDLTRREKDYVESTLCATIQYLCDHLCVLNRMP